MIPPDDEAQRAKNVANERLKLGASALDTKVRAADRFGDQAQARVRRGRQAPPWEDMSLSR